MMRDEIKCPKCGHVDDVLTLSDIGLWPPEEGAVSEPVTCGEDGEHDEGCGVVFKVTIDDVDVFTSSKVVGA